MGKPATQWQEAWGKNRQPHCPDTTARKCAAPEETLTPRGDSGTQSSLISRLVIIFLIQRVIGLHMTRGPQQATCLLKQ